MSRYIDLDSEDCVWCGNPGEYENWNVPLDMPGADVVPVVRCKDCKLFCEQYFSMNCSYHVSAVCENWFCSQGRVKKDG